MLALGLGNYKPTFHAIFPHAHANLEGRNGCLGREFIL